MILIGSNYFFKNIPEFKSKDVDLIELINSPKDFKYVSHIHFKNKCIFKWRKMNPKQFIEITLKRNFPMEIGKFLIPEFCQQIGFTIEHLKQLKSLIDNLDDKHKYEKIIFDSYVSNNGFILTDSQILEAYKEYKKYRNDIRNT